MGWNSFVLCEAHAPLTNSLERVSSLRVLDFPADGRSMIGAFSGAAFVAPIEASSIADFRTTAVIPMLCMHSPTLSRSVSDQYHTSYRNTKPYGGLRAATSQHRWPRRLRLKPFMRCFSGFEVEG
jgi:hypothetical protein